MPAAHTTLWFMGVFLFLWGVTLVVRGMPPGVQRAVSRVLRRTPRRPVALVAAHGGGDWRLVAGGVVAMGLGWLAVAMGVSVHEWVHPRRNADFALPIWGSVSLAVAVFSLTLLAWAVRGERTLLRRCPRCLYSMAGGGTVCPECGFAAGEEKDFFRPRRRWRVAGMAVVILALSPALLLVPKYQQWGVLGLVPSTVLIAGYEWLPEGWVLWGPRDNGSLAQRYNEDLLAAWQERWLLRRSVRLMVSERSSPETIVRAAQFNGYRLSREFESAYMERLIELVCDPSPKVRNAAAGLFIPWSLREFEQDHADVVAPHAERLCATLADPTAEVALSAAALLVAGSVHVEAALEAAGRHAQARGIAGRYASAVVELAMSKPETQESAMALFEHEDPAVRQLAVSTVRWWREVDAKTERLMVRMLDDADAGVAHSAASILHSMRSDGAAEAIIRAAAPRSKPDRAHLLHALTGTSMDAAHIARLLQGENPAVQLAAVEAIGILLADDRDVMPAMEAVKQLATSGDPNVAAEARAIIEAHEGSTGDEEQPR